MDAVLFLVGVTWAVSGVVIASRNGHSLGVWRIVIWTGPFTGYLYPPHR